MDDDKGASPDAAEPAARKRGLGETLRAAREAVGIDIEQASELLRIEPQFLAAIEEERFEAVGPPVFVRGYVKHYCDLLGLDPEPMLAALRERIGRVEPLLEGRRSAEDEDKPASLVPLGVGAAAILVAAAVIVWWQLGSERVAPAVDAMPAESVEAQAGTGISGSDVAPTRRASGGREVPAGVGAERSDLEPTAVGADDFDRDATRGDPAAGGPQFVTPGAGAASGGALRSAFGAPDTGVDAGRVTEPVALPNPASSASQSDAGTQMAATLADNDAAPRGASLELELFFRGESWAEITSAAGERLFYGLAPAGGAERILADEEVSVLLGNADAVTLRVNGEVFAYPAESRRGSLARFTLSPSED